MSDNEEIIYDGLLRHSFDDYPYYDRTGARITRAEFLRFFEDRKYRIVKQETVRRPLWLWLKGLMKGENVRDIFVSTVWLGIDHNFGGGPPLIFETMAFVVGGDEVAQKRCATEAEALAIHEVVKREVLE